MRKTLAVAAAVALFAGTACGPSADTDAVDLVESYLVEQSSATEAVLAGDVDAVDTIDEVNAVWQSDQWPDMSDVRDWSWNRTQAGETVVMDGSELASVASDLEDASGYLAHAVRENDDVQEAESAARDAVDAAAVYLSP